MKSWMKWLCAVTATAALSACGGGSDGPPPPTQNLAETAQSLAKTDAEPDGFSLLLAAVSAADPSIAAALTGESKLTVFAPTNAAFTSLLNELGVSKETLLANDEQLTQVLSYHVVEGEVRRSGVPLGQPITTLEGGIFKVDAEGSALVMTDERNRKPNITLTDVLATNGVLHVVDKVLLPGNQNLVQLAQSDERFSVLVEAVVAAGLVDALSAPGPLTVFAPTNDAFLALLAELGMTKEELFSEDNRDLLTNVLKYHVLGSRVLKAQVPVGDPITSLQEDTFIINASLAITDARNRVANIEPADLLARNGVIHVIDKVLLPAP